MRVDLAACYRLIAHFGMDDLILGHNSARVPGAEDQLLINPMGLMFDEITASSLFKVDIDGNQIEPSEYEPNLRRLHHSQRDPHGAARRRCVVHTHTEADIAVSAQEEGLLPLVAMGDALLWSASPITITKASRSISTSGSGCSATSASNRCWCCAITAC